MSSARWKMSKKTKGGRRGMPAQKLIHQGSLLAGWLANSGAQSREEALENLSALES